MGSGIEWFEVAMEGERFRCPESVERCCERTKLCEEVVVVLQR